MRHSDEIGRPGHAPGPRPLLIAAIIATGAAVALHASAPGALAQASTAAQLNPVYTDDSTAASETLTRVRELVGSGNHSEAARVLQILLDEEPYRLVAVAGATDRFESVRAAVHRALLADATLLRIYREAESARAQRSLDAGLFESVWASRMLTSAGFEAGLRRAQLQMEDARFEAARLTIADLSSHPDAGGAGAKDLAELAWSNANYLNRPEVYQSARALLTKAAPGDPNAGARTPAPVEWPAAARAEAVTPLSDLGPVNREGLIARPLWTSPVRADAPQAEEQWRALRRARIESDVPPVLSELNLFPAIAGDTVYVNDGTSVQAFDRFTLSPRWPNKVTPGVDRVIDENTDEAMRERAFAGWAQRIEEPASVTFVAGLLPDLDGSGPVDLPPPAPALAPNDPPAAGPSEPFGTSSRGMIIAATGRTLSGSRGTDNTVSGLDARTGRLIWSVTLGSLDPSLVDAGARGPIVVSEGRVLVACRKFLPERRLTVLILAALDARSGRLLWHRSVGSAGSLPFMTTFTQFDHTLVSRGVVYRSDDLGVLGAYRVEDGEPVWLRSLPRQAMQGADSPRAFEISGPVIDPSGESLVVLTPDRDALVRLSCADGRELARRGADSFGSPSPVYLLGVGENLVAVGRAQVAVAPIASFETEKVRLSPTISGRGINGRVAAAGRLLLVPTVTGLSVLDTLDIGKAPESVALDAPGNVVAIDSQFVTIDDGRLHSYLKWDQAERILTERMSADPADAASPATLAELAYRADKPARIVPAADMAIKALAVAPDRDDNRAARRRLFLALTAMVNADLDESRPALPPAAAPIGNEPRGPRLKELALIGQLVDRLARVAQGPDERVAQKFAAGRLAERRSRAEDAADEYQSVLDDEQTAQASWEGTAVRVRAQVEAGRRLAALVKEHGAGVYARHDLEAQRAVQALGDQPLPGELRRVAERYPVASVVPALWLRVAMMLSAAGDQAAAATALESGLEAASRLPAPDLGTVSLLTGELVSRLSERDQARSAWRALAGARARFPGLTLALTDPRPGVDLSRIESELAARIAQSARWPRLGAISPSGVQMLGDGSLLEPLLAEREPATQELVATTTDEDLSLWAVDPRSPQGALTEVWTRALEGSQAALIRAEGRSAYFLYADRSAGVIEKVVLPPPPPAGVAAQSPGAAPQPKAASAWRTQPLTEIFAPDSGPDTGSPRAIATVDRFPVPNEGLFKADDPIFVLDERTLVVVQRGGRAVGIDCDTGEVLWLLRTGIGRVYDADMAGGMLVVAGDEEVLSGSRVSGLSGALQIFDARTGAPLQRLAEPGEHPRWVRVIDPLARLAAPRAASGSPAPTATPDTPDRPSATALSAFPTAIIVAYERSLARIEIASGRPLWTVQGDDAMPATAGWLLSDALVFQGPDRTLWHMPLDGPGKGLDDESRKNGGASVLDGPRTHLEGVRPICVLPASASPGAGFVVSTFQGLLVYGPDGALGGVDALGGFESLIPPRMAVDRAMTIETVSEGPTPDGQMVFNLYALEPSGARIIEQTPIVLGARPNAMALLDGRLVLSAGGATVAIQAPGK